MMETRWRRRGLGKARYATTVAAASARCVDRHEKQKTVACDAYSAYRLRDMLTGQYKVMALKHGCCGLGKRLIYLRLK